MANDYNSMPVIIDTDMVSGWRALQTLQTPGSGVRVTKIVLAVGTGGASSAGSVSFADPVDSTVLYPPLAVTASVPAGSVLYTDNLDNQELTWRDFKITGVTATGARVFLWYRF